MLEPKMLVRLKYFDVHPTSSSKQVLLSITKGRSKTPDDLAGPGEIASTCGPCPGRCAMLGPIPFSIRQ
jgi:hypothetical protein